VPDFGELLGGVRGVRSMRLLLVRVPVRSEGCLCAVTYADGAVINSSIAVSMVLAINSDKREFKRADRPGLARFRLCGSGEMANTLALGASAERLAGSSPAFRTITFCGRASQFSRIRGQ
jgi:hypothetical protein